MGKIYMYGQIMTTESFLLTGKFPEADGYGAIDKHYRLIGGETGTAAFILAKLGCSVVLGGTHLGNEDADIILDAFKDTDADTSKLVREDFPGIVDYVIIDDSTRTCFGEWHKHFSRKKPFYEPPDEEAVKECEIVGADPYFGEKIMELCLKYGKKYLTVDCAYDSAFHKNSAADVVSHQYLESYYPDKSTEELFRLYADNSEGLTILTFGENDVMYGRKGQEPQFFSPYKINAVSTLGAGDSFKAGALYALYQGLSDVETVSFGCAFAAAACEKFPIPLNPPTMERIHTLINERNQFL